MFCKLCFFSENSGKLLSGLHRMCGDCLRANLHNEESENDLFSRLIYTPLMRVLPSAQYWKILILNFFSQKYKNNIFHKNVAPPAEMISLTNRDPILHFFGSRCIAFDNYKLCRSLSKCLYFTPYENSMYSMYVLCVTFKAIYKTD